MQTADAVIIGGGCMGTSVLYHLAVRGCTDVVLLEADALASGSTSKAAGGIRLQHADELNTRVTLRSLEEFTRFEELTGTPIGFKQVGYLFILDNDADMAFFRAASEQQQRLGIPTEVLGPEAAREHVPGLDLTGVVGATFCPLEGYATPEAVAQGYAVAARALGSRIRVGERVIRILTEKDRVIGVETATGVISTEVVVMAAGVNSTELAAPLGFELPVIGEARTIYFTSETAGVPDDAPLVIDFTSAFYFHREGNGLIFAGPHRELEDLSGRATARLPAIADVPIERSWWGFYEMSPDHNAMIGRAPIEGLFYAAGFSGHGFMQSPAVGEYLAELVLGLKPTLDLSSFSADRFAGGGSRREHFII